MHFGISKLQEIDLHEFKYEYIVAGDWGNFLKYFDNIIYKV